MRLKQFEEEVRSKLKAREFDRAEVKGVIAVLEMMKVFKKNNGMSITGATEEEINERIMKLFIGNEKDVHNKLNGEKQYYNSKTRQRQLNTKRRVSTDGDI